MVKLSISRAWDESRVVLARDGKLIGTVALAFFVLPGVIINALMPNAHPTQLPQPSPWMLLGLIPALIALVGQLSIVRLAMAPHVSVGDAIAHAARRFLVFVGAWATWAIPFFFVGSVLYALVAKDPEHPSPAAALGLLAVTGVGMFLAVRLILISAVASAETVGPLQVLRRSWDLTRGNWWRLFGFLLLCFIAAFVLLVASQAVTTVIAKLLFTDVAPHSVGSLLVLIVGQLVTGAILVILFVMLARIYVQLTERVQAEPHVPKSGI